MRFPIDWSNKQAVSRAFMTATRYGIGQQFGSLPIGWYQMHQCAALDELERRAREATGAKHHVDVHLKGGTFYARAVLHDDGHMTDHGPEVACGIPREIFAVADKKARA